MSVIATSYFRRYLNDPFGVDSVYMWIPPTNAPDGVTTTFSFVSQPVWISFNGLDQFIGVGYTQTGTGPWVVTFIDVNGNIITPAVTDNIMAEIT